MNAAERLRKSFRHDAPVVAPGAYDILTTKLVAAQEFPAVYLGSYACAASRYGVSDQSLLTMSELLDQARHMVEATELPVIADLEEGGGNAVNTYHNVRRFEAAGVAAVHIEDQVPGKLFGAGGTLHPVPIAVDKLRAALDARRDPNTLIIGRCEAVFIGGSQAEAADRCHAYAETGVDMLLVTGLPLEDTPAFAEAMGKPMAGFVLNDAWEAVVGSGLKLAIYPFQSVLIAYGAIREFLGDLRTTGSVGKFDWGSEERLELEKLLGFDAGADLAKRYNVV